MKQSLEWTFGFAPSSESPSAEAFEQAARCMGNLGYGWVTFERGESAIRFVFRDAPIPGGDEYDPATPLGQFKVAARRCMAMALLDAGWPAPESDLATLRGWAAEDSP